MTKTIAFLDSCVLYPVSLRDLLIQFAVTGLFQAKWSVFVRNEVIRNIEAKKPSLKGKLERTFELMEKAIPDFLAVSSSSTRSAVEKSATDKNDLEILAAAIDAGCSHLVSSNLSDFDLSFALSHGVRVIHPDEFLQGIIQQYPSQAKAALNDVIARYKQPPRSEAEFCDALVRCRLPMTAIALREL